MVPINALPPGTPFTLQFTGVAGPVAVKVCVVPRATFALAGETTRAEGVGLGVGVGLAVGVGLGEGVAVGVGVGVGVEPEPTAVFPALPLPRLPQPITSDKQQIITMPPSWTILPNGLRDSARKTLLNRVPFKNVSTTNMTTVLLPEAWLGELLERCCRVYAQLGTRDDHKHTNAAR
jgi:hypothetical protein